MKKIEAIVRPEKYEEVKDALESIEVRGITVSQVMGCGHQKGSTENVSGVDVSITMIPKIKFEIVVSTEEWAEKTIDVIQKTACTGHIGDGKIFVYDITNVIRVRTGDEGEDAL